jgi:leucyl/phenylalanyl-tRNA--protein transferase
MTAVRIAELQSASVSNGQIVWLSTSDTPDAFPNVEMALTEPDGLLAAGGDLEIDRLVAAYSKGIFPWYDDGQPILWWSPDPRCVLYPAKFHVAKRLIQAGRNSSLTLSFNQAFDQVIRACAGKRELQLGTWITAEMIAAYGRLHREGWAHSVEIWNSEQLVGGLYGLAIGKVFFGESMFSRETNASKFAMYGLCHHLLENNFVMLDCQVVSQHLITLGATTIPRTEFAATLEQHCHPTVQFGQWPEKTLPISELMLK